MKRNKLFGLALVATMLSALFSSCSNEDKIAVQEVEIQLTSEITPTSRVTSLDCQSTQIVEGQEVGVTIIGAKSDHNNVAWIAGANGALTNGGNAVYYAGNNTVTITAYHPYNSNWTDSIQPFSVNTDQCVEANYLNSDLLWTTKTATKSLNSVALTFSHKLAKINVTLKSDDIDDLSNAIINVCGTNITTNFNPFTGALSTATANIQDIKAGVTTSADSTASCIIIPQTVASGTKLITIKHNGKTYHYTLNADKEFVSGHSYSYTLNVKEAKVEVDLESDKIIDWDDEEISGDMEEKIETLLLPDGSTFNQVVGNYLSNNSNLTKIKFIANSNTTSNDILVTDEDGTIGYFVANEDWLEIHTSAGEFMANNNCNAMFNGIFNGTDETHFKNIAVIDFGNRFNTSNVQDVSFMFNYCISLKTVDVSKFNTSNVVNMNAMFQGCKNIISLDVSGFDTSNVTNMSFMFGGCSNLTALDVSKFETFNVTNMGFMFGECNSLTSLNVSNFDTSNVTDFFGMFYDCKNVESLDVSGFNTSKAKNMSQMFQFCSKLLFLDVTGFETSNVTNMNQMFWECKNLVSLDVSRFVTLNVTDFRYMFESCYNLGELDLSNFMFVKNSIVDGMLGGIGLYTEQTAIIKVSEEGYKYLTETTTDSGINSDYAKFVKPDGTDWN